MSSSLPTSFITKKVRILEALSVPDTEYGDLSPKGSIDKAIRGLIDDINELDGYVTTSSCAGRIAVFLEGKKKDEEHYEEIEKYGGNGGDEDGPEREEVADSAGIEDSPESEPNPKSTKAGIGGKGGGGHWLYVSHESVIIDAYYGYLAPLLGMQRVSEDTSRELARVLSLGLGIETSAAPLYSSNTGKRRYIHFKFEPMILHVLTASLEHAQLVLSAALQAGFRESGAINLIPNTSKTTSSKDPLETQATPMVAVRSMGLGLESIIGYEDDGRQICIASESDLKTLIELSNERFKVNTQRIQRFRELLLRLCRDRAVGKKSRNGEWEDEAVRKERMRNEGLERREALRGAQGNTPEKPAKPLDLDDMAGLEFLE